MKNVQYFLMTVLFTVFSSSVSFAQCPNNNIQFGTSNAPSTVGVTTILSSCLYGGEYRLVNNMQAGSQYRFETCGDSDFDTQITVYDATTGAFVAYNDDFCGLQSSVTFVSNGNPVRVLIDRFFCTSQSSCMTLRATRVTGGAPPPDPCNSITQLNCGSTGSFSLSGAGSWNPPGPWGTPGEEAVFEFTPTVSGSHQVVVTNSGFYVDLFFKSGNCSSAGFTYVDDIFSSSTNNINLTAGVTYYFLIDDENTSPSNGTISINCPTPAPDPCNNITPVNCDNTYNYSISSGGGLFNGNGPWNTPGREVIYSYTAPVSGSYTINMTNNGSGWVDLFYRTGSTCSGSGWTYIDDVFSSSSNSVQLTAGVTYLFLLDDEDQNGSTGNFEIECACIGPANGIDGSYTITQNTTITGNTDGACNDCSLRSSEDEVHEIVITCAGTYSFSTCGNATWDTYLYLTSSPCSGIIALNDDNCGLRSRITRTLSPGTYYLVVEAFSSSQGGAYAVDVSRSCDLSVSATADVKGCGYNVSCNGGSDGVATVAANSNCNLTYTWSNGATGPVATGLSAGTYSVVVADGFGCSATASVTLTEPDPLVVDAGADQVVYYGYGPLACADLVSSVSGGCPAYNYSWSNGDMTSQVNVCPSSTTTYTLNVTDDNGCTASDDVTVCVVDVTCSAGSSSNTKVEMCQVPPGNPANAHTICIDASAVPAHLAIGCQLGACGELAAVCGGISARENQNVEATQSIPMELTAVPNPFKNILNVTVSIPVEGDYQIALVDMYGRIVTEIYNGSLDADQFRTFELSTSDLPSGVYAVRALNQATMQGQTQMIVKP